MNAIWVWGNPLGFDANTVADRCIAGKINIIIPVLGHWNTDGTISFDHNINDYKNWINTIKSKSQKLRVLGCVICVDPFTPIIDISSQTMRIKMVNEMVNCVNNLGLDGFNDDTECSTNFSALLDLWNRMGIAMKNIGKISSADVMNYGGFLDPVSKNVVIDYLLPMCYNGGGFTNGQLQKCIHNQLIISNSPLVIGLGQYQGPTLSDMLSSIDATLPSEDTTKLRGFAIFEYGTMTNTDWNVWNNWSTKNKYADGITPPVLTSISINPTNPTINVKGTVQLSATCKDQNGNTMTCPILTWTSSNTSVATVDSTGKVTGVSVGNANIIASSGNITSNTSVITVTSTPPPTGSKFKVQISGKVIIVTKTLFGQYDADQACAAVCQALKNM